MWFSSKPKNFRGKIGRKALTSLKQMKLPDANKWRAHNLSLSLYIARDTELFDKSIKPWELPVLFLSEKINNKSKERNSCVDLDFQTDHYCWIPSRLIISFFLHFPYKCIPSSFEIHSVFVTVTVATCSVYLKNLITMLFVHSKHSLSTPVTKRC